MTGLPTFDILINAIPHRLENLTRLLDVLEPQIVPGVGVLICYDNLETRWVQKCNRLTNASGALYRAHIDDDDMVSPDYISRIMRALDDRPDYVGFKVRWTKDGVIQRPVVHSLRYDGWEDTPDALYRDITDKNPIKRTLAVQAHWRGGNGADRTWAEDLRGLVKREVFVNGELYYYQESSADTFQTERKPFEVCPPPPERDFVRYI